MTAEFPITTQGVFAAGRRRAREALAAFRLVTDRGGGAKAERFILMYHRVLPQGTRLAYPLQPGMYVTAETFERHLVWLREVCKVVPLAQVMDVSLESAGERSVCALTFDDGWRDTHSVAFPLLRKHGVPATVFLATGYVGTRKWFWPERLAFLLAASGRYAEGKVAAAVDGRIEELKGAPADERERVLGEMEKECRARGVVLPEERQTMTWDEAREMADAGIKFGSHTVNHVILTEAPPEVVERELVESKREIEAELGREVVSFCYPNGNWSPAVREAVGRAGYRYAVTTQAGVIRGGKAVASHRTPKGTDALALARIGVHEDVARTRAQLMWRIRRAALRGPVGATGAEGGYG